MQRRQLGIAVIGSGRIGTLRATLASAIRAVQISRGRPTAIRRAPKNSPTKPARSFIPATISTVISRPEVNAVVVSTIEVEHTQPIMQALALGKPVLVEKPLALDFAEADRLIAAADKAGVDLRVGYSRRFKKQYLLAKEQLVNGRLGRITSGAARVFNSRSQALETLSRLPADTSSISGLVYYVDLMNWLLADNPPVEVFARAKGGIIKGSGFAIPTTSRGRSSRSRTARWSTSACVTRCRKHYPSLGHAGARRTARHRRRADHRRRSHRPDDVQRAHGAARLPAGPQRRTWCFSAAARRATGRSANFTGRSRPKRAPGSITCRPGSPCVLATGDDARRTIEITLAIERSLKTGAPVQLPLARTREASGKVVG